MKCFNKCLLFCGLVILCIDHVSAQNPLIRDQFSADPTARVFGERVYIYPSHDILATKGHGRVGWFCMEDYHVFSSANLTDWTDHGVVVTQNKVPWVKPDSYSMWAPDCIYRNGKHYFYFPSTPKDSTIARGFTVGVAIADKPEGPFVPRAEPVKGVSGIDPNVFIDKDGQAYLYWSQGNIYAAKLKENMLELASAPVILKDLPAKGLKEGPFLFERNGLYYLTFPHVQNNIERLEYAIGESPLGPFKMTGVIMDESPTGCWTNHHSLIQFKNQWYLFYHDRDYSPNFDKARSVRADSLFFNTDGTIKKVTRTLRGIGVTNATAQIQVDRFSAKSDEGASVDFIDTTDRFKGWKTTFDKAGAWIQYNTVDFGKKKLNSVIVKAMSPAGSTVQIHLDDMDSPAVATIAIPKTNGWKEIKVPLSKYKAGIHYVIVLSQTSSNVEIDWVKFE